MTKSSTAHPSTTPDSPDPPTFSCREREVLHHFSNGLTYLQTARRMGIAARTVDTYLRRIRAKAGVVSAAELTRLAVALERRESAAEGGVRRAQRCGRTVPAAAGSSGTPAATRATSSAGSGTTPAAG